MDYLASIEKAIEYIETHLDEEICAEDIAKAAGYSLYHLTRIFTAVIGEPAGSYIKKRRLSNSCKKLLYSRMRILDIALESGFGSSEAFSRAFKTAYGVSPYVYRKNKLDLYTGSKQMLCRDTLKHLMESVTLKPKIIDTGSFHIAGICGKTSTKQNILPGLWLRLTQKCSQIPGSENARRFGVCETDRTKVSIGKDGNVVFTEFVGIETEASHNLPQGMVTRIIPGGRYAVFTHTGTITTLIKTYDYIWGSWVLFTKEILDDRADFEIYDNRFLGADNEHSQIDIYIPIK